MASLTLRDIPDAVLDKIRFLSERERRSLNKEMLVIVEEGLKMHAAELERRQESNIPPHLQVALWRQLKGKWEDSRSSSEIVADLRKARTLGREVRL